MTDEARAYLTAMGAQAAQDGDELKALDKSIMQRERAEWAAGQITER
jgi:hypothetical protein